MTNRPRKTLQSPALTLPALPLLLKELEASLPSLMAQPASISKALARVCHGLERAGAPMRQRKPRAAQPARVKAVRVEMPMSLPLFP
ncbi:hypothetical protein G3N95_34615 [Paraburkholderia sp. Tr-20389]|uniref:hypothetical protein n=1 Tax=Paraburkholderia sp. Tr-20389 TaxID=2703903 RepID=UPI001980E284|nr:hypothetical protein [Paraburkholderia sp. Tr-20389]MBN3758093.1 hypothetical protein [Paraburkholderia sp. Tr-20389]